MLKMGILKNVPKEFVKMLSEEITKEMTLANAKKINACFYLGYGMYEQVINSTKFISLN